MNKVVLLTIFASIILAGCGRSDSQAPATNVSGTDQIRGGACSEFATSFTNSITRILQSFPNSYYEIKKQHALILSFSQTKQNPQEVCLRKNYEVYKMFSLPKNPGQKILTLETNTSNICQGSPNQKSSVSAEIIPANLKEELVKKIIVYVNSLQISKSLSSIPNCSFDLNSTDTSFDFSLYVDGQLATTNSYDFSDTESIFEFQHVLSRSAYEKSIIPSPETPYDLNADVKDCVNQSTSLEACKDTGKKLKDYL